VADRAEVRGTKGAPESDVGGESPSVDRHRPEDRPVSGTIRITFHRERLAEEPLNDLGLPGPVTVQQLEIAVDPPEMAPRWACYASEVGGALATALRQCYNPDVARVDVVIRMDLPEED
jgi:hypothetical protein